MLFKGNSLRVEWGFATKEADLNMKTTSVFAGQACGGRQGAEGANAPAQSAGVVRLTPMWRALARVAWGQRFLLFMLALSGIASAPVSAADPPKAALPQLGSPFTAAPFVETVAAPDTLRQLASGGYALYLRHGPTNNAIPDRTPRVDLQDCGTQRPLTVEGRQLMARVGDAIRKANIPVSELHISPMCRARESAEAAFPTITSLTDPRLIYLGNFTDAEKAPIVARTRQLLSMPVPSGSNRLVLAHAPNLMDLMGYFPKEGTLVVFRPLGEAVGFEYIASIPAAQWGELLRQGQK